MRSCKGVWVKKLQYAAGIMILVFCFQNCGTEYGITQKATSDSVSSLNNSTSDPGGNPSPNPNPPTNPPTSPPPTATGYVVDQQNFMSQTAMKQVDIVWVIDNSRSMSEEASHVRNNFEKFMNQLQSQVDIRVALISANKTNDYNTQVALPASAKVSGNNIEIDYFVDSYNASLLAIAATCQASDTTGICDTLRKNTRYSRIMGQLNSFLRPDSSKVFIFVTDDDSRANSNAGIQVDRYPNPEPSYIENLVLVENSHYVSDITFLNRMNSLFNSPYRVFGFLAAQSKSNSSCEITRESKTYKSLITQKSGTYFDICQSDWTNYFNQLANQIYLYAQTDYVLSNVSAKDFKRVVSVKLNGVVLQENTDYTVQGKQISIRAALLNMTGSYNIEVTYERWVY